MFRDPPHYLKPLVSTSTPKRWLWLSCRGYTTRKRGHFEQHFQAAALGATWWTARKNVRRDTLNTYVSPVDLWRDVEAFCPQGRRVVLFGYDLAEQMRLSHMLSCLPMNGWRLDKMVMEKKAAWCLLRKDKRTLLCCDLQSWCPVSWGKIVSDTNHDEMALRAVEAGGGYPGSSCINRAVVIRDAVLQITNWIEGENLGQFRPTGSGQSFTAYRRRFMHSRLLVHDDSERLRCERHAMFTGRCEAWQHGSLRSGPYVEYDLHAAYAHIGKDCEVPTVARGEMRQPSTLRVIRAIDRYAVLADVTVTTDVECLPYSTGGRTLWPVGTFRTLLWDPELQLASEYAKRITVHRAWQYSRGPALQDFCGYVLNGMEGQTQVYGLLPQRVLKHWSRCLVGRMGLRYRKWHNFGTQDPPDVRLVTYLDVDEGTRTEMLLAGSQRLLLGDMEESPESLPQIPGWVMSECRARLWRAMTTVGLNGELVYVDTDSVIARQPGINLNDVLNDVTQMQWVPKGQYSRLTIHGPRNIHVDSTRRISGLPLTAKQTAPLEFSGEVMRSVKESMRSGDLDMIVSLPREFHFEQSDLRRQHNLDGTTRPYRLEA